MLCLAFLNAGHFFVTRIVEYIDYAEYSDGETRCSRINPEQTSFQLDGYSLLLGVANTGFLGNLNDKTDLLWKSSLTKLLFLIFFFLLSVISGLKSTNSFCSLLFPDKQQLCHICFILCCDLQTE